MGGKTPPRRLPSKQDTLNAIRTQIGLQISGTFPPKLVPHVTVSSGMTPGLRPLCSLPTDRQRMSLRTQSCLPLDWPPCSPAEGTALLSQRETRRQVGLGVPAPVGFGRVTQGKIPLALRLRSPQRLGEPRLWSGDGPPGSLQVERSHQTPR